MQGGEIMSKQKPEWLLFNASYSSGQTLTFIRKKRANLIKLWLEAAEFAAKRTILMKGGLLNLEQKEYLV